jgi:hypothetical protein
MYIAQSIQRAQGVNAFGSCLMRVDPDYVSVRFAVTRVAPTPKEAFDAVRAGARSVRERLAELSIRDADVRASEIGLEEAWSHGQERKKIGYEARVSFHLILADITRLEALLTGVVDAGANQIVGAQPKTSKLKELRKDARERAVRAARDKADDLARAAGARLGAVLHIEDVNADEVSRRSHMPDVDLSQHDDAGTPAEAHNPGSIVISAAVMACFALA